MPIPSIPPALLTGPFSRAAAHAAGVTDSALRGAPWRQVFRGVYVHADAPDTRDVRLQAARLVLPPYAVLCGITAAWVYGADVRAEEDLDVHAAFPPGRRTRSRNGLQVCQETLRPTDIWTIDGIAITAPVRTVFDCMRLLRGDNRLVVADVLTYSKLTTVDEVSSYFAGQRRMRNLRIARLLIDDIEPLAESPMATRMRLRLVAGGLPRPVAQHEVTTAAGTVLARLDLAYPDLMIAIEYDGSWHWKQRRADDRRRAALRALDWDVLVYSADDVYGAPERMVAEVAGARRARLTRSLTATK